MSVAAMGKPDSEGVLRLKIAKFRAEGSYDSALYTFKQLERLCRSKKQSCELVQLLVDFAEFYRSIHRAEKAILIIQEAEEVYKADPKCEENGALLYNRYAAICAESSLNGVEVLRKSLKAIELASKTGDSLLMGRSLNEIGMYHWGVAHNLDSSGYYFRKAYEVFSLIRDTAVMCEAAKNLATYYFAKNQFDQVISFCERVVQTSIKYMDKEMEAAFYALIFRTYEKRGDYKKAFISFRLFHDAFHSMQLRIHSDGITKAETRFNVLTKEKKIEEQSQLLKFQKYQLSLYLLLAILAVIIAVVGFVSYRGTRKKNKRLSQLLAENNLLTVELNHRVKNNFQLIVNIINHELRMEEADVFSRLSAVGKKIEALSALHKQLYNHADKMDVSLKPYILDITNNFEPILDTLKIQTEVAIDEISIEEKTASYIGLLVTELITNSLKHAFGSCESPKISLSVHKTVEGVVIDFRDNGKGLESNVVPTMVAILSQQIKAGCVVSGVNGFSAKITLSI